MNFRRIMSEFHGIVGRFLHLVADAIAFDSESSDGDGPRLDGSNLMGEYNFRTGRADSGNDPIGWYEDDF